MAHPILYLCPEFSIGFSGPATPTLETWRSLHHFLHPNHSTNFTSQIHPFPKLLLLQFRPVSPLTWTILRTFSVGSMLQLPTALQISEKSMALLCSKPRIGSRLPPGQSTCSSFQHPSGFQSPLSFPIPILLCSSLNPINLGFSRSK